MSPSRLAMVSNALGLQEEEERESSFVSELGRSSERMALDWVSAVGSTGSLISSWTSAGVLGVSMIAEEDEGVKELIIGSSNVKVMRIWRRLRAIEYTSCIEDCDEVEAKKF